MPLECIVPSETAAIRAPPARAACDLVPSSSRAASARCGHGGPPAAPSARAATQAAAARPRATGPARIRARARPVCRGGWRVKGVRQTEQRKARSGVWEGGREKKGTEEVEGVCTKKKKEKEEGKNQEHRMLPRRSSFHRSFRCVFSPDSPSQAVESLTKAPSRQREEQIER